MIDRVTNSNETKTSFFSGKKAIVALVGLAILFSVILSIYFINKHNAFNTRTYDFGRFAQAVWNVLHGRFLFTTIDYHSILGNHFSPYLALLAPFLLIWPDEKFLLILQVISVAVAGIFLALILYRKYPRLAVLFLLAFYLNPALQELTLFEFRRVVLVLPFLALALLALAREKKLLMLGALLVALLGKEDIGLFVAGVGLFLLIIKRDIKWGVCLLVLGLGWAVIVSLWVIPAFRTPGSEYPQLYYFDYLGGSYSEILSNLLRDPLILFRQLFTLDRLAAIGRILLPLGFVLPFFGAEWLIIALPPLALLMLSGDAEIFGLLKWYPTTILPVLFAATAVGIGRSQPSRAKLMTIWLLVATIVGYLLFSPLPGGRRYDPALYDVTDHDRKALDIITRIPPDASVATQPHIVPHLALRKDIYHFPWVKIGLENVDFLLLDCTASCYPLSAEEFAHELENYLVDPNYTLAAQADNIYLLEHTGEQPPRQTADQSIDQNAHLYGFAMDQNLDNGEFIPVEGQNSLLREVPLVVTLYWEALAGNGPERTISVRIEDSAGNLIAQHDGLPGNGSRPISQWQPGQKLLDRHFLTLPPDLPPGTYTVSVLLYDTFTTTRIPFDSGLEKLDLGKIQFPNPN